MYAKHFTDAWTGRIFSQSCAPAVGIAIPIFSATAVAGSMPLWNPPGSGVIVELISVDVDYGGGSTAGFGSIGLMAGPLQAIATASGCSVFSATAPVNGYLLQGPGTRCVSSNLGTITVTAGTGTAPVAGIAGAGWVRTLFDFNLEANTGTAHGTGIHTYNFDGTVAIPPGVLVYLAAGVATIATYCSTMIWKEVPNGRQY